MEYVKIVRLKVSEIVRYEILNMSTNNHVEHFLSLYLSTNETLQFSIMDTVKLRNFMNAMIWQTYIYMVTFEDGFTECVCSLDALNQYLPENK